MLAVAIKMNLPPVASVRYLNDSKRLRESEADLCHILDFSFYVKNVLMV